MNPKVKENMMKRAVALFRRRVSEKLSEANGFTYDYSEFRKIFWEVYFDVCGDRQKSTDMMLSMSERLSDEWENLQKLNAHSVEMLVMTDEAYGRTK